MHRSRPFQGLGLVVALTLSGMTGCQTPSPATEQAAATPTPAPTPEAAQPYQAFGHPMQGDPQDAVAADVVLASTQQYVGQTLRIRGRVQQVCQKRGCWLTLTGTDPQHPIFVKFADPAEGRLIPANAVGREVIVEGQLQQTRISQAMARHFAQDGGATEQQIADIQGPQPLLRLASPSARVLGLSDDAPPSQ